MEAQPTAQRERVRVEINSEREGDVRRAIEREREGDEKSDRGERKNKKRLKNKYNSLQCHHKNIF